MGEAGRGHCPTAYRGLQSLQDDNRVLREMMTHEQCKQGVCRENWEPTGTTSTFHRIL